jgi:hypothetical protein
LKTVRSARTFPLCALPEREKRGRNGEWATARRSRNWEAGDRSERGHRRGRLGLERRTRIDRHVGVNGWVPGTGWRARPARLEDLRERSPDMWDRARERAHVAAARREVC